MPEQSHDPGERLFRALHDAGMLGNADRLQDWNNLGNSTRGNYAEVERAIAAPGPDPDAVRPTIVCLCGSTRFWREFQQASLRETLAGRIVLSIGAASGTDDERFGNLPRAEYDRIKAELDELHLRKIDLADEVYVLNCGGYVGTSTAREVAYAKVAGKPIRYLEEPDANAPVLRSQGGT